MGNTKRTIGVSIKMSEEDIAFVHESSRTNLAEGHPDTHGYHSRTGADRRGIRSLEAEAQMRSTNDDSGELGIPARR
jgi:hypothetical protein